MKMQRQISLFNATATRCISMRKFITKKKNIYMLKVKLKTKIKKNIIKNKNVEKSEALLVNCWPTIYEIIFIYVCMCLYTY